MNKNKDREVACKKCGMPLLCDCKNDDVHYCQDCVTGPFDKELTGQIREKKKINDLLNEARFFHNSLGDEEEAIRICDKILQLEPGNRDAMLVKAGSLNNLDRRGEAIELITKIKGRWPDHWEAYYLNGLNLFNENEEEAMREFEKSLGFNENFDNLVCAAQLAYFMQRPVYREYLDKAKKLDLKRFHNFMRNYWENELV